MQNMARVSVYVMYADQHSEVSSVDSESLQRSSSFEVLAVGSHERPNDRQNDFEIPFHVRWTAGNSRS